MNFIERVNRTQVTPELMIEANLAVAEMAPEDRRDLTARSVEIVKMLEAKGVSPNGGLLIAINFRLAALARLETQKHKEMIAWFPPSEAMGMVFAHEELFKAAAMEPLITEGDQAAFEPVSFLRRLLALSKEHGRG